MTRLIIWLVTWKACQDRIFNTKWPNMFSTSGIQKRYICVKVWQIDNVLSYDLSKRLFMIFGFPYGHICLFTKSKHYNFPYSLKGIPITQMGVLTNGSAHARLSARPPSTWAKNFSLCVCKDTKKLQKTHIQSFRTPRQLLKNLLSLWV